MMSLSISTLKAYLLKIISRVIVCTISQRYKDSQASSIIQKAKFKDTLDVHTFSLEISNGETIVGNKRGIALASLNLESRIQTGKRGGITPGTQGNTRYSWKFMEHPLEISGILGIGSYRATKEIMSVMHGRGLTALHWR